ncbi:peptidase U4 sporulation factor SpoIIGA [Syntrophobotulus glycolicus DSM 8271]|uniref:Sporulation sigma-E factor-processing peptidase n=1 Tax=Syntrophobotulus glycolicus (strain DSM 8271 / FlGlyR) TaxID=645991 RepID=F0T005_SYNGF|nr:sigma-E processing peptidase SpoIIGA [Syntrophobotulus glycolicus]ADY55016.1 peptidase U4 sporulation factor SpoIIGA [Syntrophobotulus glycolicus DSM 8271]
MYYLDIVLLINGLMDALILLFASKLLHRRIYPAFLISGALLGEIPILLALFPYNPLVHLSKVIIPLAVAGIGMRARSWGDLWECFLYFTVLTAMTGGAAYAGIVWFGLADTAAGFSLTLDNIWLLLALILVLCLCYRLWGKNNGKQSFFSQVLYRIELDFGGGSVLKTTALLDTGNELRDPLTDKPMILIQENVSLTALPRPIAEFLQCPWRDLADPCSLLWNSSNNIAERVTFIRVKGVNGQSWLPGVRSVRLKITEDGSVREKTVTAVIVPQLLSSDNKFEALLHPDHVCREKYREEIA